MVLSKNEWCSKQNLEVKIKSNIKQNKIQLPSGFFANWNCGIRRTEFSADLSKSRPSLEWKKRAAYSRKQQDCSAIEYKPLVGAASDNLRYDLPSMTNHERYCLAECSGWTVTGKSFTHQRLQNELIISEQQEPVFLDHHFIIRSEEPLSSPRYNSKIPSNNFHFTMPLTHTPWGKKQYDIRKEGCKFSWQNQQTWSTTAPFLTLSKTESKWLLKTAPHSIKTCSTPSNP